MADIWYDVDAALAEVPVNILPLVGVDGLTIDAGVTYDEAGIDLNWNFVTTAGAHTQTNVVPTTGGVHDWAHAGNGMYTIEIPASGGTVDNDTEGFGWWTGDTTATMPFRSPVFGFRAAGLNNVLIDSAYSATRGLAGTAVPDAVADAAGGLPISDAGGLDLDAILAAINDTKLWSGTFTTADATTITMADEADANAIYVGARVAVVLVSGTNCNGRVYFGTVGATRVITVDGPFTGDGGDTPSGTIVGAVYAMPKAPTLSIPTVQLADGHLVAAKFGADCITADKIADDAIVAANLATGAITADAFAADAIVAATLATGAITADAFAADAIVAATLATGALTADAFAADAIVAATLATNAITTDALADGTITADKLGADCITNAKIADNAIAAEQIAADAIAAAKIATGALTADAFAADAIVAATLATGAITADAFAADAIVAATFATDSITADALADNAITAATFADDAIAAAKIATGALTADAFAADAIVAATLATGAITADAFAADAIVAATLATNAITSDALAASACTKIVDDFETQSQADPTGFHVNTMEIESAAALAGINAECDTAVAVATAILGAVDDAAAAGAVTDTDTAMAYIKQAVTAHIATTATLANPGGLKKNTEVVFPFRMTDSTNHVPTASLTITAERMLDGAAFAACANAVVEDTDGWYHITLAAADVNGDSVALKFTATGADQLDVTIITEP